MTQQQNDTVRHFITSDKMTGCFIDKLLFLLFSKNI